MVATMPVPSCVCAEAPSKPRPSSWQDGTSLGVYQNTGDGNLVQDLGLSYCRHVPDVQVEVRDDLRSRLHSI